jgi:hypothetical protein
LSTGRGGPLTGYSTVYIDSILWDIDSESGEIIGVSSIQCQ